MDIPDIITTPPIDQNSIKYAVMVVDDSAFIRGAVARAIESDQNLIILSSVSNGQQAVNALQRTPVDVIVLDIEMPVMDGLTALPKLKEIDPAVQVIMASTLTQKNAEISLKAMSLGATDYIPKPSSGHAVSNADDFKRELVEKIKALGSLARRSGVRPPRFIDTPQTPTEKSTEPMAPSQSTSAQPLQTEPQSKRTTTQQSAPQPLSIVPSANQEITLRKAPLPTPQVLAIGSSTGGPQALFQVIKDMGSNLPQPIVITQHMPPSFTSILAEHISKQCNVTCHEAKEGDVLQAGHYYVAPGDYHMVFKGKPHELVVNLIKDPPENFCRPAVDPMLRSLSSIVGGNLLVAILTGMGMDGTQGCQTITKAGGAVIAQDEATSVVWGMPGAVALAGLCSAVLPVNEIGSYMRKTAMRLQK